MTRPSILDLARRHAERRLPRKKRNADLRRLGYDPDGAEGEAYRQAFERAKLDAKIGRFAARQAQRADVTVLWEPPADDWRNWLAAGCGEMPRDEYLARLSTVERELADQGLASERLIATTAEVLAELARLQMPNDPAGRAAATSMLWLRGGPRDRIRPASVSPPEIPRAPGGLRILGAKLNERSGAACAVWQVLSTEELLYELTGRIPLATKSVRHDEIAGLLSRGQAAIAWLFPESDAAEWRRRGFGDCDYAEYLERLENLRRQVESAGAKLYLIECGVRFMEEAMRRRGASMVESLQYLFVENFRG